MSLFSYIKSQVSILDVTSKYVHLKQIGGYYKGKCPFHKETDASFTVSPDKEMFYCFGCHASGDVITFISKIENVSQKDAAELLVNQYGLKVPTQFSFEGSEEKRVQKQSHFTVCRFFAQWAHDQLKTYAPAREYILNRGFSHQVATTFMIGFMPGGVKSIQLLLEAARSQGMLAKDFIAAGILMEQRTSLRSAFEQRILFPIRDALGRYCGFGGRIFLPNDSRAKYYNSKESDFFLKGHLLFNFDLAKQAFKNERVAYLVEGYTDCLAMVQAGYEGTVATLGTACTKEHLSLLSRYVDRVYVVYDGDKAGQAAMLRLTQLCWHVNIEVFVVQLAPGVDPASCVVGNVHDLAKAITDARDIMHYFIAVKTNDFSAQTLAQKVRSIEEIVGLIREVPNMITQELLLQSLAHLTQLPSSLLRDTLNAPIQTVRSLEEPKKEELVKENNGKLEGQLLGLYIMLMKDHPEYVFPIELHQYFSPRGQYVLEKIEKSRKEKEEVVFGVIVKELPEEHQQWILSSTIEKESSAPFEEFNKVLCLFFQHNWKEVIKNLKNALTSAHQEGDKKRVETLLRSFTDLKQGMQLKGLL